MIRSRANIPVNDKTRFNCHVQYSLSAAKVDDDTLQQYYGRIHFFLNHSFNGICHTLALIECFSFEKEIHGYSIVRCARLEEAKKLVFVDVASIDCLIGLIHVSVEHDGSIGGRRPGVRGRQSAAEANWWVIDRTDGKQTFDLVVADIVNS